MTSVYYVVYKCTVVLGYSVKWVNFGDAEGYGVVVGEDVGKSFFKSLST